MNDINQASQPIEPPALPPQPVPPSVPQRRARFGQVALALALALVVASYAAVVLINRVFLTGWVARALPEGVLVRRVYVRWPATVVINHAQWASGRPEAPWLQVPYAALDLDLSSLFLRRVVVRRVLLDRPRIHLLRNADGEWNLPPWNHRSAPGQAVAGAARRGWRVAVLSVEMQQGAVVFDDRRIAGGFRGELQACDVQVRHPFLPLQGWRAEVEMRALAVLRPDRPKAPVHLQGRVDLRRKDLAGTLTVKTFDIGALEPYLNQGRLTVRLYQAQLDLTAELAAQHNDFSADGQLTLAHLTEGDVSIRGVNVLSLKDASGGPDRSLQLRLQVRGPLDDPRAWRPKILPTGEQTVKLLRPLFEGRKETIILKVIPQVTGQQAAADVEETVKSVQRGLRKQLQKLLETPAPAPADTSAPPTVEPTPPPATEGNAAPPTAQQ